MTREMVRLKNLTKIKASNVDKKSVEGDIPVGLCNYTDVYHNDVIRSDFSFMQATATRDQVIQFSLRGGDVLITKDSETAEDIGVPALVSETLDRVLCGYHLSVVRPVSSQVEPKYLFWALKSELVRAHFASRANGVTRFALGHQELGDTPIVLPSRKQQRTIVRFLDEKATQIDTLIEKQQALLELLRQQQEISIRGLLTGRGRSA